MSLTSNLARPLCVDVTDTALQAVQLMGTKAVPQRSGGARLAALQTGLGSVVKCHAHIRSEARVTAAS
ncbi:hypothetical protein K376_00721 [Streptomyces sp. PsTaAH-130]|nr:hypothetical protein K376_00721 [Streptomyces sp. PsTaAH-130]